MLWGCVQGVTCYPNVLTPTPVVVEQHAPASVVLILDIIWLIVLQQCMLLFGCKQSRAVPCNHRCH
jgi:hypothetical protein